MTLKSIVLPIVLLSLGNAQSPSSAVISNLATAPWIHDKGDPPGSESVMLREDAKTGGMELVVRFPAGHVIAPHSHESNERILVLEGQLHAGSNVIDAGGYAFLPAREVQRLSCSQKGRCTFYLAWDGNPKSFPAK